VKRMVSFHLKMRGMGIWKQEKGLVRETPLSWGGGKG